MSQTAAVGCSAAARVSALRSPVSVPAFLVARCCTFRWISLFRYIINAMREAYQGQYFSAIMVEGIAVAVGMAVLFVWQGSRVFVPENA